MSFPVALCICLVFFTGLITGAVGLVFYVKWAFQFSINRENALKLAQEVWPLEWSQAVIKHNHNHYTLSSEQYHETRDE